MEKDLITVQKTGQETAVQPFNLTETYQENLRETLSESTRRAYGSALRGLQEWLEAQELPQWPVSVPALELYLREMEREGKSYSSINTTCSAVSALARSMGEASPCDSQQVKTAKKASRLRMARAGLSAPVQKEALRGSDLRAVVSCIDTSTIKGKRDKALLLLGFAGAFRRSELSLLTVGDLKREKQANGRRAFVVTLRRSKTDQTGEGQEKAIFAKGGKYCPYEALQEWLKAYGAGPEAPLFPSFRRGDKPQETALSGHSVARLVKKYTEQAGLNPEAFSGHSLRRGFVTACIDAGANERQVMRQTGHKSPLMVRRYIEHKSILEDNASALL